MNINTLVNNLSARATALDSSDSDSDATINDNIIYGKTASQYEDKDKDKEQWTEEEYYQHVREAYYFHELSYIGPTIVTTDANGDNHYKDIIRDYGCGHPDNPKREGQRCWCVPECPFYPETGKARFENNRHVVSHD